MIDHHLIYQQNAQRYQNLFISELCQQHFSIIIAFQSSYSETLTFSNDRSWLVCSAVKECLLSSRFLLSLSNHCTLSSSLPKVPCKSLMVASLLSLVASRVPIIPANRRLNCYDLNSQNQVNTTGKQITDCWTWVRNIIRNLISSFQLIHREVFCCCCCFFVFLMQAVKGNWTAPK